MSNSDSKILITGGAGFIGSDLADNLIALGYKVFIIDNLTNSVKANVNSKAVFIKEDIRSTNLTNITSSIEPDYIFHLAAQASLAKSIDNPKEDIEINLIGTQNIIEAANKNKVQKIIFSSSAAVYGVTKDLPITENEIKKPISIYGISKLSSEHLLRMNYLYAKMPYTVFRYANVYGEKQSSDTEGGVVPIFINQILSGNKVKIFGDGSQTRDFVNIKDVSTANILSLDLNLVGEFNIGTGIQTSINNLYLSLTKIIGKKSKIEYLSHPHIEVLKNSLAYNKINKIKGWKPNINLNDALKNVVEYYKG